MMTTIDNSGTEASSAKARKAMIDSQLRTSGVNEEFALARMMAVPREQFLPEDKASLAYIDRSVRVEGGALASPLFYGKALLEAAPTREDRVLVVEGGTGYLAELLKPLVASLDTVSAIDAAKGDVSGSYTLIIIDGAIEQLPEALSDTLEESGRVVSGLLLRQVTRLASGRRIVGQVSLLPVEDLGIPVLHAFDAPKTWTFS
ncbi:MAG: protein-L-isoaspartate O-methyltransferase [Pseudomonadota bacterium]